MAGGVVLVILGVTLVAQLTVGDALTRLGVLS